jgi:uncharacterized protein YjbI with pentapeptide repeats
MANQEHLDILKQGVKAWNSWRMANDGLEPDLSDVPILEGARLSGFDLSDANFSHSNLQRAKISITDLHAANFTGASLRGAEIVGVSLAGADLTETDLRGARISQSTFGDTTISPTIRVVMRPEPTVFRGTRFDGARISLCYFHGVDLSEAHGLGSVETGAPSSIDIDTIYLSKGKIPESFLRGAGVPENFITYMRSLTGAAFDFYSCFISYSTKDQDFADRLYADLQAKGVRCWFAPHDIQGGRKVHEEIDEAIRVYDKLLLILSDASMNSNWVKTEIANAPKSNSRSGRCCFRSAWCRSMASAHGSCSMPTPGSTVRARSASTSSPIFPTGRITMRI